MTQELLVRLVLAWRSRLQAVCGERGASLTEYGMLVALIACSCIAAVEFLGDVSAEKLSTVGDSIGQP